MKVLFAILCLVFVSCNENNIERNKQELINTDIAMSDLAMKEGFNHSIFLNADTNIVKFEQNQLPLIGKNNLAAILEKSGDIKTLSWKPVGADVAASGDLGYTWGNWKYQAPDTAYYGNYFTAWKKQKDGRWKVALDGGNSSPKPE
jgi:ketosteroid isomerase-like protein